MPDKIYFFIREEPYGFLSNFERTGFIAKPDLGYSNVNWAKPVFYPTNEHYYQATKANCQEVHDYIVSAPHARLAMVLGRQLEHNKYLKDKYMKSCWAAHKLQVMLRGLRHKFADPELKKMLLDTGDAILHENNLEDPFWGIGDGTGDSWLGKLLMIIREECKGWSCHDIGYCRCGVGTEKNEECPVGAFCELMSDYTMNEIERCL